MEYRAKQEKENALYEFRMALKQVEEICENMIICAQDGDLHKAQDGFEYEERRAVKQHLEANKDAEWYFLSYQEEKDET